MKKNLFALACVASIFATTIFAEGQAAAAEGAGDTASNDVNRAGGNLGVLLGFGAHSGYGFGLGVEGGYTLPMHLFLGGNFTYFTGSDHVSAWLLEGQVGYDFAVAQNIPILIRPYAGLGYESLNVSQVCVDGICAGGGSTGSGLVSIGALGSYFITPHWYVGADLRVDIPLSSGWDSVFDAFATGGYKF